MKKILLTIVGALAAVTCIAFTNTASRSVSNNALAPDQQVQANNVNREKVARVLVYDWTDTDTVKYFVGAQSYNQGYSFNPNGGDSKTYEMGVVRDGNRIVFTNLMDLYNPDDWSPVYDTPIEGVYDETAGTITFDANVPYCDVWGSYTGMLKAFTEFDENGNIPEGAELSQLVFNVTPDFKTITAATPFGSKYDWGWNQRYKTFSAQLEDPNDPAHLVKIGGDITFDEVYGGMKTSKTFAVLNDGGQDAEYVITIEQEGDEFSAETISGTVAPYTRADIVFNFAPAAAGEYEAIATIETEDQSFSVVLNGKAREIPDLSSVVLRGDFTFETGIQYPAEIAEVNHPFFDEEGNVLMEGEGEDATPVTEKVNAIKLCTGGIYGESFVKVKFNVPEGMMGKLSFKGALNNPTKVSWKVNTYFEIDSDQRTSPKYQLTSNFTEEDTQLEFAPGEHFILVSHYDGQSNDPEVMTYIWDLDLDIYEPVGYGPEIKKPEVFMGFGVVGRCEKIATIDVRNKGVEEMKVLSVTCDNDEFEASVPKTTAGLFETIQIPVEFIATKAGLREGNFTIETNLGTVEAKAYAKVCEVPDYNSIVTEGNEYITFSIDEERPFMVEDGKAFNITSKMPDDAENESSLPFVITVPEGHIAHFSFTANSWGTPADAYATEPFWDFSVVEIKLATEVLGSIGFTACFYDNDVIGANEDYWAQNGDELFSKFFYAIPAGTNEGRFYYKQGGDKKWYGEDRIEISNIKITLTRVDGVDELFSNEIVGREYFDLQGNRIAEPENGLFIERTRLSNGQIISKKVIRK